MRQYLLSIASSINRIVYNLAYLFGSLLLKARYLGKVIKSFVEGLREGLEETNRNSAISAAA